MKEDLIWDLKMEGVTELQINQIKVGDIRHNGVIFVINTKILSFREKFFQHL